MHLSRITMRKTLAILLAAVVLSFGIQAAGHWHGSSSEDHQCQVCHFAHSVAPPLLNASLLPMPTGVARLVLASSVDPKFELVVHQTFPRAPPA